MAHIGRLREKMKEPAKIRNLSRLSGVSAMKSNKNDSIPNCPNELNRFFLSLLILLAVMMGGYFLAWFICKQFIWYDYSPFTVSFKTLQMLSPSSSLSSWLSALLL